MTEIVSPVMNMRLVGGSLCLDFANTLGWRDPDTGEQNNDRLLDFADLVAFGLHTTILTESQTQHLLDQAQLHPARASRVLGRARELREAIFTLFAAAERGLTVDVATLHALNSCLGEAMAHTQILPTGADEFTWSWVEDADALDRVLWHVARSAAELLTSEDRHHVRECESATCSWLFLDHSKNHRRRWCSMEECGNRAKVRKFRHNHPT